MRQVKEALKTWNLQIAYADEQPAPAPTPAPTPEPTPAPTTTPEPTPTPATSPNFGLLSNPEVALIVERVRTEEKNKLHTEIERLKAQVNTERTNSLSLSTRVGELTVENGNLSGQIANLNTQIATSSDERVATLQADVNRLTGELASMNIRYSTLELTTFRDQAIAAAEGRLIVEMVSGSTMDEINASVARAKEAYAKYNPQPVTTTEPEVTTPAYPVPSHLQQPVTTPVSTPEPTPTPASSTDPTTRMININPMSSKSAAKAYGEFREKGVTTK